MLTIEFNPPTVLPDLNRLHIKTDFNTKLIALQMALFFKDERRLFQEIDFLYDPNDENLSKIYAILHLYYRLRLLYLPFLTHQEEEEYCHYVREMDASYFKQLMDEMPGYFSNHNTKE